jgi:hypothetical protein
MTTASVVVAVEDAPAAEVDPLLRAAASALTCSSVGIPSRLRTDFWRSA